MSRFIIQFVLITASLTALSAAEPASKADSPTVAKDAERPGWKLVWSDEFDHDGLPDPAKWNYEKGFLRNNELQYYTEGRSENARVENGMLVIEARKEEYTDPHGSPKAREAHYTSASLTTKKSASWTYGRIEVRAKLPKGKGTWPAIWMLGNNHDGWPKCGEIDIMENVGFDPDGIHATVHTQAYNHIKHTAKGHRTTISHPYDDFHVYGIEWNAKAITFLVDDNKVFSFENDGKGVDTWPYDRPEYLLINFAVGGAWGGARGVDESIFPQKYLIDYVRVYEKADGAGN